MTLHEQFDFLCAQASIASDDGDKRRLMECAATMFDFWQDQHEEVIRTYGTERKMRAVVESVDRRLGSLE